MIIGYFLAIFVSVIGAVLSPLPTVQGLPFGADAMIIQGVAWVHAFTLVFWPASPILTCILLYIPIKMGMVVLRAILGSRVPDAS